MELFTADWAFFILGDNIATRLLQGYLQACLQGCLQACLQACLQGCYKVVTRLLQGCYEVVTRLLQCQLHTCNYLFRIGGRDLLINP